MDLLMPATSPEQARFMQMCRHAPEKAEKPCPPKSVAKEFSKTAQSSTKGSPAFTAAELAAGYRTL